MKSASSPETVDRNASNAIGKVCSIFRTLSSGAPLRLNEVSERTGFNRVTALRILDELVTHRFVDRAGTPPRYSLGPEAVAMAAASSVTQDVRTIAKPSLVRLASFSEDTVLLSVRSGVESICVDRIVGTFPIQATYLQIGSRRWLGVGAGSMALLAWLPETERESILDAVSQRLQAYPRISRSILGEHVETALDCGYVKMLDIVVDRIGGIGYPIRNREGEVVAAISIAALTERIVEREMQLVETLRREVNLIQAAISA